MAVLASKQTRMFPAIYNFAMEIFSQPSRRQHGVTAIMFIMTMLGVVVFSGMALDLVLVHHRRQELDLVARTVALAAARQLNGEAAGIDNALARGAEVLGTLKYRYGRGTLAWRDEVLSFGASPDGGWIDAGAARAAPAGRLFVRADTARLDVNAGSVTVYIISLLYPALRSVAVAATAVAGRSGIDVMPLAVCAMSEMAGAARSNPGPPATVELVEYGFRRGVGYDLMQLNPHGVEPVNFVIHPFRPPGAPVTPLPSAAAIGPHVCTGQLAITTVFGGPLTVEGPFPLPSYFRQLNSRFNLYENRLCTSATAMVDSNPKQYARSGGVPWMAATPDQQGALATTSGGKLRTIADLAPPPAGTQARMYGPLWAYARAVPFSAWSAGADEPAGGYATFGPADWASLYGPGAPAAKSYPGTTPYQSTSGVNYELPPLDQVGLANRRVLNVPLLACPVAAGGPAPASVLAIGKFMMTVPATEKALYAEFGGLAPAHTLGGPVELYR